ncbi:hypothetical protein F5884DRAFT_777916 [Xylogone sp. PMI_703]|nr:hypothetical protein F5884DRAFT_777916 [Xylogone sp. PMI_703]
MPGRTRTILGEIKMPTRNRIIRNNINIPTEDRENMPPPRQRNVHDEPRLPFEPERPELITIYPSLAFLEGTATSLGRVSVWMAYYKQVYDLSRHYLSCNPGDKSHNSNKALHESIDQLRECKPMSPQELADIEASLTRRLKAMKRATQIAERLKIDTITCEEMDVNDWMHRNRESVLGGGNFMALFNLIVGRDLFSQWEKRGDPAFHKPHTYLVAMAFEAGMEVEELEFEFERMERHFQIVDLMEGLGI